MLRSLILQSPQPEHWLKGSQPRGIPDVQEELKLTVIEQIAMRRQRADTEDESMMFVTIQQDTSIIPPMTSPMIGPVLRPDSPNEETKKKSKQDSPNTPPGSPPPPPPPSGASGASGTTGASDSTQAPPPPPPSSSTHRGVQSTSTAASSSLKSAASAEYSAWTTTDTWIKPSITTIPDDLYMDDETTADEQAYFSGDETIPSSDLTMPTNNWASALKATYAPPQENSLLAQTGDMATFMDWYCKRQGITHLTLQDLEGPAFEIV
ncbi:hypothetical protein Tco_1205507, partial [Tanacetum coccineum]